MDGILVINKPFGITSHGVVERVRKIVGIKKVGHAGTLDSIATGVLLILLGKATRISRFLQNETKDYEAKMFLGMVTDTQDSTGKIISDTDYKVTKNDVERALESIGGELTQIPPLLSAVKVRGRPAYKYARKGVKVHLKPREIKIYQLKLLDYHKEDKVEVEFFISCSKGTYIRALCASIGERLGCGGCMSGLTRLRAGEFTIDQAISLDEMVQELSKGRLSRHLFSLNDALVRYPGFEVKTSFVSNIVNGQHLKTEMIKRSPASVIKGSVLRVIDKNNNLLAVAKATEDFSDSNKYSKRQVIAKPLCVLKE